MIGLTRRGAMFGLAATALASCAGAQVARDAYLPVYNPAFDAWVARFRRRAAAQGIGRATLDAAFRGVGYLPGVVEKEHNQAEFTKSFDDYLGIFASPERVREGRAAMTGQEATLAAIERRYGVEPEVVAAIWGVESRYGQRRGDIPVVSALSTLAFDSRRGTFFERQLVAALTILQRGETTPGAMTGSWAGAMGHTQFMPTSYLAYAVDFTGDGRADIWSDDPTDALASTAAYLARFGWRHGQPWGMQVRLPARFPTALAGRRRARSASAWNALGVRTLAGRTVPDHGATAILLPDGGRAPAFAVWPNFNVLLRYNSAELYGLGVGTLSDRLLGRTATTRA